MTSRELELRAEIMRAFAETGAAPHVDDHATLAALAEAHVVVLDGARHDPHGPPVRGAS